MSDDKIGRALDKLQNAGPDARVVDVIDADELEAMRAVFAPLRAKRAKMTPRVPPGSAIATETVGRYEREE